MSEFSSAGFYPPTAWTRIVLAGHSTTPAEAGEARRKLCEIYDRPLLRLFQSRLSHRSHDAEDWKQDFLISHLMSGRMFENARRGHRFRSYLAQSIRNYISSRNESEHTRQGAIASAAALSSLVGRDEDLSDRVADGGSLAEDERLLTYERARACVDRAIEVTIVWAAESGDQEKRNTAQAIRAMNLKRPPKPGTPQRETVDHFKQLLCREVREELLVEPGQDEQEIIGREAALLLEALQQTGKLGKLL
jgi:DNA-directed RNA polymerase specialized sigma24 family protein